MTRREDNLRLLELLQRQHRNQRLIYAALAIAVASVTAVIARLIWLPSAADDGRSWIAYGVVIVVTLTAVWLMHRLSRENEGLRQEATELARKLGLIP